MNIKVLLILMLKILFVQKIYTQELPPIITKGTVEYFMMNYFEVNISLSKIAEETSGLFFEKNNDFYEYLFNEMVSEKEPNIEAIIKKYNNLYEMVIPKEIQEYQIKNEMDKNGFFQLVLINAIMCCLLFECYLNNELLELRKISVFEKNEFNEEKNGKNIKNITKIKQIFRFEDIRLVKKNIEYFVKWAYEYYGL